MSNTNNKIDKVKLKDIIKKFIENSRQGKDLSVEDLKYNGLNIKVGIVENKTNEPKPVTWLAFLGKDQKINEGIFPAIYFDKNNCLVVSYGVSEKHQPKINWKTENLKTIKEAADENKNKNKNKNKYPCNLGKIAKIYGNSYIKDSNNCFFIHKDVSDELIEDIINKLDKIIDEYNKILGKNEESKSKLTSECLTAKLKLDQHIIGSFYNALKTKGFVILAGLSGTGKTKIFEEFVRCFPYEPITNNEEFWIVIEDTKEKLVSVKIKVEEDKEKVEGIISFINENLQKINQQKVETAIKLGNYYVKLIKKLREILAKEDANTHTAAYNACLLGFEIIQLEENSSKDSELKPLDKKLELIEIKRKKFNNHLFLAVRPDFKDSKSLLGFYNPLKGTYHSTPLLDFILEASRNYLEKGKEADPFFVLFDEMNLAKVEYYFADFLSVLEAKRFKNKNEAEENEEFMEFIKTFSLSSLRKDNFKFSSQGIWLHNEETNSVPKRLFLPPNLYFVGTVNIDETTYMFSPKVLDRAFTIEFDVGSFNDYLDFLKTASENKNEVRESVFIKEDFTNKGEFAVIDKSKIVEFLDKEMNIVNKLEEINSTLKRYNLHFGYRVFDEIAMFLYNSQSSLFTIDKDLAFDLAIKMKVLPKFHGTRQVLWDAILELLRILDFKENLITKISEELNGIPEIVKEEEKTVLKIKLENGFLNIKTPYLYTTQKLLELLYKLKSQGFASFI